MSNASAQTAPTLAGDATSTDSRRSRCAARRRLLLLGFLFLLVAVGAAANYGPLRHYQDAHARLEKVAGEVAGLEEQRSQLQSQLAKLSEAGYLEGLARQELTYARTDEELYIVSESAGGIAVANRSSGDGGTTRVTEGAAVGSSQGTRPSTGDEPPGAGLAALEIGGTEDQSRTPSAGVGAGVPGADLVVGSGVGAIVPGAERSGSETTSQSGLLERIVAAIAGLF